MTCSVLTLLTLLLFVFLSHARFVKQQLLGRMDADALRSSGMLQLLTSPDGRAKLQGLAQQVTNNYLYSRM